MASRLRSFVISIPLLVVAAGSSDAAPPPAMRALPDAALIQRLTGMKGTLDEKAGVYKVSAPRKDLKVNAGGVHITPPMGLTSWAAFTRTGPHTAVMGDTVMTEDQVNPVMSVALDGGLQVTALHNHFFWDSPKIMFMHIAGMGDEAQLAKAVGAVFAKIEATKGGKGVVPSAVIDPARSTLEPKGLDVVFAGHGAPGEYKDGVYKIVVGRSSKMEGHEMGKAMGVNTWAAFAGSNELATVDGDFAMLESELQRVLKTLRKGGINIVAIHQHMAGEQPRILFLHYWGLGRPADLARTVVAALDETHHEGTP
jgi:hypothetical protein